MNSSRDNAPQHPVTTFIDPRTDPDPRRGSPHDRTTPDSEALKELHQLCRQGRLYDIERWIQDDRPLQLTEDTDPPRGRWSTALEIALERGDHALTLLLLCNGYDPNLEPYSPLDAALQSRRKDLLDLLLAWGAAPHEVDLDDLFDTYDSKLFAHFRDLGVNLTANHAMACALAYHTSNKPLYGFARRLRKSDPKIQAELNAALAHHADEGNERGVALCLWAGADPRAPACYLRWGCDCDDGEEPRGFNAIWRACRDGHLEILERFGPHPKKDDWDELYRAVKSKYVFEYLMDIAPPNDPDDVIRYHVSWAVSEWGGGGSWWCADILETAFKRGLRWRSCSKDQIANVRRSLLKASVRGFIEIMKALAKEDHCSPEILHELARTPAIRRRMTEVGFLRRPDEESWKYCQRRPTRFLEVRKKFGLEPSKEEKEKAKREEPLPRRYEFGWANRRGGRELRLDRKELYERVWSEPVTKVAAAWGISDVGLRKQCRRLKIPTPGRGYWAKVNAGRKPRRPRLPKVPDGQAEEIVVWVRE